MNISGSWSWGGLSVDDSGAMSNVGRCDRSRWTVVDDDDLIVVTIVAVVIVSATAAAATAVGGAMVNHTSLRGGKGVAQNGATNSTSNKTRT